MPNLSPKTYLVTGGAGFIGSALVRRLVREGQRVRVLDNLLRGSRDRLADIAGAYELIQADIRDAAAVERAVKGVDSVCHLASVNGTSFFYSMPELVLDVGVKGIANVIDACLKHDIGELIVASSSEVYHAAPVIPTDEGAPLTIPDPSNPRYSYAACKILNEVMALNYGRKHFRRVLVFRPHNVYGPDMGWEHVIPQFVVRMKELSSRAKGTVAFPIQGTGKETRAFIFIEDFVDGLMRIIQRGAHLNIYHIGTTEELTIETVARLVAKYFGREITLVPGQPTEGEPPRRCPDISKMQALGFRPKYTFPEGLPLAARWYDENAHRAPTEAGLRDEGRGQAP